MYACQTIQTFGQIQAASIDEAAREKNCKIISPFSAAIFIIRRKNKYIKISSSIPKCGLQAGQRPVRTKVIVLFEIKE